MDFMASDTENNQIADGTRLEFAGPEKFCREGKGYRVVINKDHTFPMSIDAIGHLMTGDGKVLDDVAADVTIGDRRFGMLRTGMGQLGPTWIVNGDPYNEKFAPNDTTI